MKWTSSLLALLAITLSYQSLCLGQQTNQASITELKEKIKTISTNGLSMLSSSKSCFEKVNNELSFNQCVSIMPDKIKKDVINLFAPPENILNLKSESAKILTYSQENNQKILGYLSASIQSVNTMMGCLEGSVNVNQIRSCCGIDSTTNTQQQSTETGNSDQLSEDW